MVSPLPPVYLCRINTPGYLAMADDACWHDTPKEAWQCLHDERRREEDQLADMMPYSVTVDRLLHMARGGRLRATMGVNADDEGVGYMHAPSPDAGPHDLGTAYSVTRVDHRDYPHPAGYLPRCPACEARCHCEPDTGSDVCVYQGEHS